MGKTAKVKSQNSDAFVSDDAVSSGASSYMKLVKGENKLRIISKPIIGWLLWEDKKPTRMPITEEPESTDDDNPAKKFMAVVVIDHTDGLVKIWEMTQQSIIKAIKALTANPDWGNPFTYDLTIDKSGEDLKTKYVVTPSPKKPLGKELVKVAMAKPCNLDALYEGEDPWSIDGDSTEYFFK